LIEHCNNPWKRSCSNQDIVVYIEYKNEQCPICSFCWLKIADSLHEWGNDKRPPYKTKIKADETKIMIHGRIRVEDKEDRTLVFDNLMKGKVCTRCHIHRTIKEFPINHKTKQINSWCKGCCSYYYKLKKFYSDKS